MPERFDLGGYSPLRVLASGFLALVAAGGAAAGPLEDGITAYNRGDYIQAIRFWRPLADQGQAEAESCLGLMYRLGRGVPQDYAQAAIWYRKAAAQGDADAQYSLGWMYDEGKGLPQDYAAAMLLWRPLADHGNGGAQYDLGVMYAEGLGVPQDYLKAHMWFNLAVAHADAENLHVVVEALDSVAAIMTPDQIAEAELMAREWVPK